MCLQAKARNIERGCHQFRIRESLALGTSLQGWAIFDYSWRTIGCSGSNMAPILQGDNVKHSALHSWWNFPSGHAVDHVHLCKALVGQADRDGFIKTCRKPPTINCKGKIGQREGTVASTKSLMKVILHEYEKQYANEKTFDGTNPFFETLKLQAPYMA